MKPIWTKSKWKKNELSDKTVEYRMRVSRDCDEIGVGKFVIGGPNPKGLLFVQIERLIQNQNWKGIIQIRYYLPQDAVDRIQKHPDSNVADFLLA